MCLQLLSKLRVRLRVGRPRAFAHRAKLVFVLVQIPAAQKRPDVGGVEEDFFDEVGQRSFSQHGQQSQKEADKVAPNHRSVQKLVVQKPPLFWVHQLVADAKQLVQQVDRPTSPQKVQENKEVEQVVNFLQLRNRFAQPPRFGRGLGAQRQVRQQRLGETEERGLRPRESREADVFELTAGKVG